MRKVKVKQSLHSSGCYRTLMKKNESSEKELAEITNSILQAEDSSKKTWHIYLF